MPGQYDFVDDDRYSFRRNDATISGYLMKQSSSGAWQKRYFETSGGYLTYYKNHNMSKLLAAIAVPQVGGIRRVGPISDNYGSGVVFEIELKDRKYQLRAANEDEAQQWIDFLIDLRDGNLHSNTANPMNSFSNNGSGSYDSFTDRRSRQQSDPAATATLNKSTRINLCACVRVY